MCMFPMLFVSLRLVILLQYMRYNVRMIGIFQEFPIGPACNFLNMPTVVVEMLHFRQMEVLGGRFVGSRHKEVTVPPGTDKSLQWIASSSFASTGITHDHLVMVWI